MNPSGQQHEERSRTQAGKPVPGVDGAASLLTEQDLFLFNEGSHFRLYNKLGAHRRRVQGQEGTTFAVWAPAAVEVSVIGEFNAWKAGRHRLLPRGQSGIWEGFIAGIGTGQPYKYHIRS